MKYLYRFLLSFPISVLPVKEGIQLFNRKISNRMGIIGFLFLHCHFPSYAVPEKHFNKTVIQQLYPSIDKWSQSGFLKGVSHTKIHYRIYGKDRPQNQPVVIVPGWSEFSLKYMELAHDLIQKNFSPVYVLDHRGQGASERQLKDTEKSYVEDFLFYVKDLKIFLNTKVLPRHPKKDLYLIAHSMGGAISLLYTLNHPNTFRAAAITAPMLRINTPETVQSLALFLSSLSQLVFRHQSFLINKRTKSIPFDKNNPISHSPQRYEFNKYLENKYPFYIRGASLKWLREAIKKSRKLRKNSYKAPLPLLFLNADQDRIIDNKANKKFCLKAKNCTLITFEKAKHEILMEKDEVRNQAIKSIIKFFKSH